MTTPQQGTVGAGRQRWRDRNPEPIRGRDFTDATGSVKRGEARYAAKRGNASARAVIEAGGENARDNVLGDA